MGRGAAGARSASPVCRTALECMGLEAGRAAAITVNRRLEFLHAACSLDSTSRA
jgi:hypothetical protein